MSEFRDLSMLGQNVVRSYDQGRERRRVSDSRQLFGQAAQGDQTALKGLYETDPDAAYKLDGEQKQESKAMHQEVADLMWRGASALKASPAEAKAQVYQMVVGELRKNPNAGDWLADLPEQYDPATVDPVVEGIIAKAGMYQPQEAFSNAGQGFMMGNRGSSKQIEGYQEAKAQPKGQAMPQPQKLNDEQIAQGANAMIQSGKTPEETEAWIIQQQSAPDFQSAPSRASPQPSKPQRAPSGYRFTGAGDLEPIPGGPAARKGAAEPRQNSPAARKTTEDQNKAAGYARRMELSLSDVSRYEKADPSSNRPGLGIAMLDAVPNSIANYGKSEARQNIEAAQMDALDAALTLNTGAAYTKEQLASLAKAYFPQPGNTANVVEEKKKRLQNLIDTARTRAGSAYVAPNAPTEADASMKIPPLDGDGLTAEEQKELEAYRKQFGKK